MRRIKVEIFKSPATGLFHARWKAKNGEILWTGEGHKSRMSVKRTVNRFCAAVASDGVDILYPQPTLLRNLHPSPPPSHPKFDAIGHGLDMLEINTHVAAPETVAQLSEEI